MDDDERQYWFDRFTNPELEIDAVNRVYKILDTERRKLEEIDNKFQQDMSRAIYNLIDKAEEIGHHKEAKELRDIIGRNKMEPTSAPITVKGRNSTLTIQPVE